MSQLFAPSPMTPRLLARVAAYWRAGVIVRAAKHKLALIGAAAD